MNGKEWLQRFAGVSDDTWYEIISGAEYNRMTVDRFLTACIEALGLVADRHEMSRQIEGYHERVDRLALAHQALRQWKSDGGDGYMRAMGWESV